MFNKVDRLILDSLVICSYCSGRNISKCKGVTTTLAGTGDDREKAFKEHRPAHEHGNNSKDATYTCFDCQRDFYIVPLDGCWCGWRQSFEAGMSKMANWLKHKGNNQ